MYNSTGTPGKLSSKAAIVVMVGVESWERPGRVADPLSLDVDVTSWYDEEQLRLVKGTN
jgi:hypothetical protein